MIGLNNNKRGIRKLLTIDIESVNFYKSKKVINVEKRFDWN